ncbi:MAG: DNA polymerase III subunit gamma/tau [Actinobacteria bacterium]|uniref:DNA-directed DNA polymerase n=1 Tax=freshwater metagenome TaxID=449393 RepID=A0A6J6UN78_9ZZZZ|nr:DNA polymerase III subunit gamma/tau [Actinomycetota bacterium]
MATQSLYRRFRPRKFSELYGQDHVVKALRNAVINGREGQAYLFSGPRGTGKTSTARILAKVLNCESPIDGEPCCLCDSCKAVELGTSYDVLELDAASNNGVQEIRDIIEAAALTSPGRHRVFILDEVHMLTRGAEAALLKTLEEPPNQVVFVLATTDPQKVSDTIRSRVQHLQFHLLPVTELEKYVRFVIAEAQLTVDDDSIDLVLRQGGGSARDTLSALELIVAGGGEPEVALHTEDIIRSLVARDHAAALAAVARAMQQGHDPHTYAQDVVRTMRDCFLSLMSPELVQLPADRISELHRYAQDMGVQRIVRIMETLGSTMVEMRHAPDARLLLEVAVVQLASPVFDDSAENLLARISQLEDAVKTLRENGVAAALPQAPINPATGRAKIGGHAGNTAPVPVPVADETPVIQPAPAAAPAAVTAEIPLPAAAEIPAQPAPPVEAPTEVSNADPAQMWPQITDAMRGLAKAMFKPAVIQSVEGKRIILRLPNNTPMKRAQEQLPTVVAAIKQICGGTFVVTLVQADPTAPGGMSRPVLTEPEVRTIVDEVADDPFAAIDINDTVLAVDAVDPLLAALHDTFPGGSVIEKTVEVTHDVAKSPRGKK